MEWMLTLPDAPALAWQGFAFRTAPDDGQWHAYVRNTASSWHRWPAPPAATFTTLDAALGWLETTLRMLHLAETWWRCPSQSIDLFTSALAPADAAPWPVLTLLGSTMLISCETSVFLDAALRLSADTLRAAALLELGPYLPATVRIPVLFAGSTPGVSLAAWTITDEERSLLRASRCELENLSVAIPVRTAA